MRTWKEEINWLTRRAYYRGFIIGALTGAALTIAIYIGRLP